MIIKKIEVLSLGKISGILYAIIGVIVGVFMSFHHFICGKSVNLH